MREFKSPGFQERRADAALARSIALSRYRNRTPIDAAVTAEKIARRQLREAVEADKRSALRRAKEEADEARRAHEHRIAVDAQALAKEKADADARAKVNAKAARVAERKSWTEEDRKAARDARYAARKMRQARR